MSTSVADLFAKLGLQIDSKSFNAADKLLSGVKTALGAIALYKGVTWATGLIKDTVELGGHLNDLAQTAGVPIETLQELGYAAGQNSSSLDEMAGGLGKLSKTMYAAAHGGKAQSAAFKAMGVSVKDSSGKLRPVEDVLGDVADHLSTMPDGAEKTAMSMGVLGKSGASLIPTLNAGSAGLKQAAKDARDLGGVVSADTVKGLDDLGDSTDQIKTALLGVRNDAIAALLPMLKEMAASTVAWLKANRAEIVRKITAAMRVLITVFKVVAKVIGVLITILAFLGDHWKIMTVLIGSLLIAMLLLKIGSIEAGIAMVASGLAAAAAWLLAALPMIAMAALIAIVILVIEDLYRAFTGGRSVLKKLYEAAVEYLGNTGVGKVLGGVLAALGAVIDKAKEAIGALGRVGKAIGGGLWDATHTDEEVAQAEGRAAQGVSGGKYERTLANTQAVHTATAAKAGFTGNGAWHRYQQSRAQQAMDTFRVNAPGYVAPAPTRPTATLPNGKAAPAAPAKVHAPVTIHVHDASDPHKTAAIVDQRLADHYRDAAAGTGAPEGNY